MLSFYVEEKIMGAYGPTTIDIDKFFRSIKGSKTEKRLRKDIKKDEKKKRKTV